MKRISRAILLVLFALAPNLYPEEPQSPLSFSCSISGLRPLPTATPLPLPPPISTPALETNSPASPPAEDFALSLHPISYDYTVEHTAAQFEHLNGTPALIPPPPSDELGGAAGWVKNEILEPALSLEVVRVRKVAFTGSIITAVKRKNPLYLLNPLVFAASW